MPAKKIVSDIYTIKSPYVTIEGNLNVVGTQTTISTVDSAIRDSVVVLNDGEQGDGVSIGFSGIEVDRGPNTTNAYIKYRELDDAWILDKGDGTPRFILTSASSAGGAGLTAVVEDTTPTLGGNLSLAGNTIRDVDANVELRFGTVENGGSGVFVSNNTKTNQELITRRRAFVYALIL